MSALQGRLSRLSAPQPVVVPYNTASMVPAAVPPLVQDADSYASRSGDLRQRAIILASLALTFAMLGFDLMGLLVLHMR